MVDNRHVGGIVYDDEPLLLFSVHTTHQDQSIILCLGVGRRNKDWLSGKPSIRKVLGDQRTVINIELDNCSIQIEDILGHVGKLVRLGIVGRIDVGELKVQT